ncbi:hypothetical protein [Conexibacter sp. W3-3-2]|uniref:hypothetical protein n=1 Tax=Conexibacter sp. W3-3-2 TaxID=2675227 RepID=UPI0018A924F6|nr:hypothetical protein [Conexibacter sp. W3-3-2]
MSGAFATLGELLAVPEQVAIWLGAIVLLAFAILELTGVRRSLLLRQTPRMLPARLGDIPGSFAWGVDTGAMVTTYRTSFATWALLSVGLLGLAGPWVGAGYAAGFVIPLAIAALCAPTGAFARTTNDLTMAINARRTGMNATISGLLLVAALTLTAT